MEAQDLKCVKVIDTSLNSDISGSYTTDSNGRIQINGLEAGQCYLYYIYTAEL